MKRTILATSPNGTLFIKAKEAGMPFLCLMIDGIAISYFGNEKTPYITVDQAINWHEKELPHCKNDNSKDCLEALRHVKQKYAEGSIQFTK